MDFFTIFNAFNTWSKYNHVTANQRSLFFALLEIWNETRLVRSDVWLSIPNAVLEQKSCLSKKTCDNVKNQLVKAGILKIKQGSRNKNAPKYEIETWIVSVKDR